MSSHTLDSARQVLSNDEITDLVPWPVMRLATEDFLRRVHHVFIFNLGSSALLFTSDNRVYALGINEHGFLGVGPDLFQVTHPTEVSELRGKTVVQCVSSHTLLNGSFNGQIMVLTSDGHLYGWGYNFLGQVGCGNQGDQYRPVVVMQNVTMVACGSYHTAAIQLDGTVWAWGNNRNKELGLNLKDNIIPSARMVGALRGQRVVQVDCGISNCVALTDQGRLYLSGYFGRGNHSNKSYSIHQVSLPLGLTVISVVASACPDFSNPSFLIHTSDGHAYLCYYTRNNDKISEPECHCDLVELNEQVQAITKVGWLYCLKLLSGRVAFMNYDDSVYHTSLTSIAEVCALYFKQAVTPGMTVLSPSAINPPLMLLMSQFDHPLNFNFQLTLDWRDIYINTEQTAKFSLYLAKQVQDSWSDDVEIDDYRFVVYFTWLRYLYTGTVGTIEPWWVDQLLALATVSNTAKLRDICLHFIIDHFSSVDRNLHHSEHWSTILDELHTNLTPANIAYYHQLTEEANDKMMQSQIWHNVITKSLSTARKILSDLRVLSGESNYSDDEGDLLDLLQNIEHGMFFLRHLANTAVTSDNCFLYYQVAVRIDDKEMQENVVRSVAKIIAKDSISLFTAENFQQADDHLSKELLIRVSTLRANADPDEFDLSTHSSSCHSSTW